MSGGQRQCVAIARTANLRLQADHHGRADGGTRVQETAQVENIIRTLKDNGEPLILISHNMRQCVRPLRPHRRLPPRPQSSPICASKDTEGRMSSPTSPAPRPERRNSRPRPGAEAVGHRLPVDVVLTGKSPAPMTGADSFEPSSKDIP